jgi:serine/threonine protein kinase
MADRVGQRLGNYHLVRLLGQGGFAQVYLGEHLRLGTQAAIKLLFTHLSEDDVEQFLAEARVLARLEHPHIIRILDFDVEQDIPFLVMNYAPNGTLRQRYPKGTRLSLDVILIYLKQAAVGILSTLIAVIHLGSMTWPGPRMDSLSLPQATMEQCGYGRPLEVTPTLHF